MILIFILLVMALILLAFVITSVAVVGAGGIIIFADVIVCIVFIVWLIKKLINRKK